MTAVDIIEEIYALKKDHEPFVLSSGHAGLAQYVVLESRGGRNAEDIFNHHGVHPDRCELCHLDVSAGSLGHGLPIACGLALSDRTQNVYCLISDGEMAEGSIWEALRFMQEQQLYNLKLYVNINGWGAYGKINPAHITSRLRTYEQGLDITVILTDCSDFSFLRGLDAHYVVMDETMYTEAVGLLTE